MIINKDTIVSGTQYQLNDLCPKQLFLSYAGEENALLTDSVWHYDFINVTFKDTWSGNYYTRTIDTKHLRDCGISSLILETVINNTGNNGLGFVASRWKFDNEGTSIEYNPNYPIGMIYFNYYDPANPQWHGKDTCMIKICKVVGYQVRTNNNTIDQRSHTVPEE